MWLSRRIRACILLSGLSLCLMILIFAYGHDLVLYSASPDTYRVNPGDIKLQETGKSSVLDTYRVNPGDIKLQETGKSSVLDKNVLPLSLQCNSGRLGNQMCTYATLYGISALNRRHSISLSCNIDPLKGIFVGPSKAPTKDSSLYLQQHPWELGSYLKPQDASIPLNSNFLNGYKYPCSFTFFDHVRDGIRREFQFHEHFNQYAQTILHRANEKELHNITFVGVHVRRGDYKKHWLDAYEGVPVNMEYFQQAFQYFQEKYKNVVFVAISDDRLWCANELHGRFGVYVPEEAPSPAHDLAILSNCNHTVMTYGTFGFWGGYLAGGEVLYFDKFLKPNTSFNLENFVFEKMYPPYWKGIVTVNVSDWFQSSTTLEDKNVT